jgi:hypothetical protein
MRVGRHRRSARGRDTILIIELARARGGHGTNKEGGPKNGSLLDLNCEPAECQRVRLRAVSCHRLPTRSFAECLPKGIPRRFRGRLEIMKALQTRVNELVDRSGFEPLTSAVQRHGPN